VADLRQLALILRPPSLDDLGLTTAPEAIAEREGSREARRITLHCAISPPKPKSAFTTSSRTPSRLST
jgi:signal transduction histidine kinase